MLVMALSESSLFNILNPIDLNVLAPNMFMEYEQVKEEYFTCWCLYNGLPNSTQRIGDYFHPFPFLFCIHMAQTTD